ncbi:hypothetical protein D320_18137 [Haloferax sp. BAB-2207]|nr:hypothetical protein D320_18137 [Haloferax sp. BAB-2207]
MLDESTLFQPGQRGAYRPLVEVCLCRNFAGLERPVVVGDEESEDLVRDRQVREFLFARVLEVSLSIDIVE